MPGIGMRPMRGHAVRPTWGEGVVDRQNDHIKISYGERRMPVAWVARAADQNFIVEFSIGKGVNARLAGSISKAVHAELDFYLLCSTGPEPWAFARYHCDTVINACAVVHWSWQPKAAVPPAKHR